MNSRAFFASSAGLTPIFASRSLPPFSMMKWHRLNRNTVSRQDQEGENLKGRKTNF